MGTHSPDQHQPRRVWVVRWMVEGSPVRQLAAPSGYSPQTLRRRIAYGVARPPPLLPECSAFRSRLFDGTSLAHRTGVLAVMDAARFPVVSAAPELAADPAPLQPVCATLAHHG